jgi:hypothetical protein
MATVATASVIKWQHGKKPTWQVKIGVVNWPGWKKVGKVKIRVATSINQSWVRTTIRGGVRSTRGLGPTMTARGQSIGISIGMLPQH